MVQGLYDKEIQQEVLARDGELQTFIEKYKFIEAQELGRRTKTELEAKSTTNAVRSRYQKDKRRALTEDFRKRDSPARCNGCNSEHHSGIERQSKCPAWGNKCDFCGNINHFQEFCFSKKKKKSSTDAPRTNVGQPPSYGVPSKIASQAATDTSSSPSYFYSFSSDIINHYKSSKEFRIQNIEWNGSEFTEKPPDPLPTLQLTVRPMYECHGNILNIQGKVDEMSFKRHLKRSVKVIAYTDTCAQTCVAGESFLHSLSFVPENLLKTSHKIKGVSEKYLDILGVLLVNIDYNGQSTSAAVYICRNIRGFFVSAKVQKEIGIISSNYPHSSSSFPSPSNVCKTKHQIGTAECGCPIRTKPPPRPDKLPYPATDEYRELLHYWLLEYFESSAFNNCEHQKIPKLSGEPLIINFNDTYTPKAYHTPIPVPVYWRKEVKEGIDKDVDLGVLETSWVNPKYIEYLQP